MEWPTIIRHPLCRRIEGLKSNRPDVSTFLMSYGRERNKVCPMLRKVRLSWDRIKEGQEVRCYDEDVCHQIKEEVSKHCDVMRDEVVVRSGENFDGASMLRQGLCRRVRDRNLKGYDQAMWGLS